MEAGVVSHICSFKLRDIKCFIFGIIHFLALFSSTRLDRYSDSLGSPLPSLSFLSSACSSKFPNVVLPHLVSQLLSSFSNLIPTLVTLSYLLCFIGSLSTSFTFSDSSGTSPYVGIGFSTE